MLHSALGFNGSFSAPHRAAALARKEILDAGGTAIEAMVAAAATIAVVYPHMNGIGGDRFWLIKRKAETPIGISGCGRAVILATADWYAERGHRESASGHIMESTQTIVIGQERKHGRKVLWRKKHRDEGSAASVRPDS